MIVNHQCSRGFVSISISSVRVSPVCSLSPGGLYCAPHDQPIAGAVATPRTVTCHSAALCSRPAAHYFIHYTLYDGHNSPAVCTVTLSDQIKKSSERMILT